MAESREPFVSGEDRPDVSLKPDMPITELRVRDLAALIQSGLTLKKRELKEHIKEFKHEKFEIKELKLEKFEIKELKLEKLEKLEIETLPKSYEPGPEPGPYTDPRIDRLIELVSGLAANVEGLSKRIDVLEKRRQG